MKISIKQHCIIAILLCTSINTFAQNVEQIFMKSGSVVEGYIAEQVPGKRITIQTSKATIVVNSDSLQNKTITKMPLQTLSNEWKEWAEQNKKYVEDGEQKYIELATLYFNNSVFQNVYLLERGSLIKFLDMAPNKYTFKWGDMYRTVKTIRPANLFSGLKETIVLHDNTAIEGQIIEQLPGKDLKILTTNGDVLSYKYTQVKQIITEKLNNNLDLWSQIQLLDKIKIKNEEAELVGFISSRLFGKEIVFVFEDDTKRTIPLNDVISYAKITNEKYTAVYETILEDGEILLDGKPAYFVDLKPMGQYLTLGNTVSLQKHVGETVCLEARLEMTDTNIVVVQAHTENVSVPNGRRKVEIPWPVITYQDLVQSRINVSREITHLNNIKVSFELDSAGDYVIHIQGMDKYIVINVIP